MPPPHSVHVIDATWIHAVPAVLAQRVADPRNWHRWWPGLRLAIDELRGAKGVRWAVLGERGPADGRFTGSMEVYLQPVLVGAGSEHGTLAHFLLRLDVCPGERLSRRATSRLRERYRRRAKQVMWELSDGCDPGRLARVRAVAERPAALSAHRSTPGGVA